MNEYFRGNTLFYSSIKKDNREQEYIERKRFRYSSFYNIRLSLTFDINITYIHSIMLGRNTLQKISGFQEEHDVGDDMTPNHDCNI